MHYKKREFARYLRKDQTPAEEKLWCLLRNRKFLGLKFRRQHVIEGFVVDFYCDECKLAIELDGKIHDHRKDYDELRDEALESEGINLVRIRNREIEKDPETVLRKIKKYINAINPTLLPLGEGR